MGREFSLLLPRFMEKINEGLFNRANSSLLKISLIAIYDIISTLEVDSLCFVLEVTDQVLEIASSPNLDRDLRLNALNILTDCVHYGDLTIIQKYDRFINAVETMTYDLTATANVSLQLTF